MLNPSIQRPLLYARNPQSVLGSPLPLRLSSPNQPLRLWGIEWSRVEELNPVCQEWLMRPPDRRDNAQNEYLILSVLRATKLWKTAI